MTCREHAKPGHLTSASTRAIIVTDIELFSHKPGGEPYLGLFERVFSVGAEDIEIELRGYQAVPWADFLLNPRRLRGSDFLMRWSQGVWSERRVVQAVNATGKYFAMTYGPSGTAPNDDPRSVELYFERLEQAGLGEMKRPDILIFRQTDEATVTAIADALGGAEELPFIREEESGIHDILSHAILAAECENSLWKASQMPHYGSELRPMRRLNGQLGLPKNAVLPTVIVKEEDRAPLREWQQQRGINIHIWHMFYDMAFGLALDSLEELISTGRIQATQQTFQAPGGANTEKIIYRDCC